MFPRVPIIILNWNGWRDTVECLESLYRITYPNYDVIIVDNGSQDSSIQKIKEYAKGKVKVNSKFFKYNPANKPIKVFEISEDEARQGKFKRPLYEKFDPNRRLILIRNKDNYGFAGGNNIGIKFALSVLDPDYMLLLNNDTAVLSRDILTVFVQFFQKYPEIGALAPRIVHYDTHQKSQYEYLADKPKWKKFILKYIIPSFKFKINLSVKTYNGHKVIEEPTLPGTALFIRSRVLVKTGVFNSLYFCYGEEVDLLNRIRDNGFFLGYVPNITVAHKGSVSANKVSGFKIYYRVRNTILFSSRFASKRFVIYLITVLGLQALRYRQPKSFIQGIQDALSTIKTKI